MKLVVYVFAFLFLTACGKPVSPDVVRARALLTEFNCSTANGKWKLMMADDVRKATLFLANREKGVHLFNVPIDEIIAIQLSSFKIACNASNRGDRIP